MDDMSKRIESVNKKILEILESAKPEDEDFCDKVAAAKGLYAELNKEIENIQTAEHNAEMISVEDLRLHDERVRDEQHKRIKIAELAVTGGTFLLGIAAGLWKFSRATKKENPGFPETIDTLTDRTVVQDGLRDEKPFKLPWSTKF